MIKKFSTCFFFLIILFSSLQCGKQEKEFTVWIGGSPEEVDFWANQIKEFEHTVEYKVNLVRQPSYTDQRRQSLVISLEAEQPNPDVFLMDVVWMNNFIRSGWLISLDSLIKKDNFDTSIFFPSVFNSVDKLDNKVYAFPVFIDVALLYYRQDLLHKFGYSSAPKLWSDLKEKAEIIQTAQRKTNPGFNGFLWQGAQYEGLVCTFLEFIASNGGNILRNGRIDVYSKKNLQALTFMQNLIQKYKISPPNTYTEMKEEEVRRAFQNGNALFERNWSYAWALHQSENSPVKGKIGMAPLPHFRGSESTSALGGWHIGISKYSDTKEKAWQFIKFITSYNAQKKMVLDIGWNPVRKDIYEDEELLKQIPRLKILYQVFQNTSARPNVPYYPQASEIIQRYINNCLAGKISPQKALEKIQQNENELMELYSEK